MPRGSLPGLVVYRDHPLLPLSTKVAAMPSGPGERYDFFLSRRGSVAAIAHEVADVLVEKGYRVFVQDYDIPFSSSLVEKMHERVSNSRDLSSSHMTTYSPATLARSSSFEAQHAGPQCAAPPGCSSGGHGRRR
jgi:hypothetical protein